MHMRYLHASGPDFTEEEAVLGQKPGSTLQPAGPGSILVIHAY